MIRRRPRDQCQCEFHVNRSQWSAAIVCIWLSVCGHTNFDMETKYHPAASLCRGGGDVTQAAEDESAIFAYVQTLSNACVAVAWQDNHPYPSIPKRQWLAHGAAYLVHATDGASSNSRISKELQDLAEMGDVAKWARAAYGASSNRVFATTSNGYYILGPKIMEPGDLVCVLKGAQIPFCLRPWGGKYLLVGECYMHGVMDGRLMETAEADGTSKTFEIV